MAQYNFDKGSIPSDIDDRHHFPYNCMKCIPINIGENEQGQEVQSLMHAAREVSSLLLPDVDRLGRADKLYIYGNWILSFDEAAAYAGRS